MNRKLKNNISEIIAENYYLALVSSKITRIRDYGEPNSDYGWT